MSEELKIPHHAKKLLSRLQGGALLCRNHADTEEATAKGGGYLYFTVPNNRKAPPGASKFLIEHSLVKPRMDGLFDDDSQTFEVA